MYQLSELASKPATTSAPSFPHLETLKNGHILLGHVNPDPLLHQGLLHTVMLLKKLRKRKLQQSGYTSDVHGVISRPGGV